MLALIITLFFACLVTKSPCQNRLLYQDFSTVFSFTLLAHLVFIDHPQADQPVGTSRSHEASVGRGGHDSRALLVSFQGVERRQRLWLPAAVDGRRNPLLRQRGQDLETVSIVRGGTQARNRKVEGLTERAEVNRADFTLLGTLFFYDSSYDGHGVGMEPGRGSGFQEYRLQQMHT